LRNGTTPSQLLIFSPSLFELFSFFLFSFALPLRVIEAGGRGEQVGADTFYKPLCGGFSALVEVK